MLRLSRLTSVLAPASGARALRPLLLALVATAACAPRAGMSPTDAARPATTASGLTMPGPVLKELFASDFHIGAALNVEHFTERDTIGVQLLRRHFSSITPEDVLKWENVHPEPGRYDFRETDRYVAFGERHDMMIIGHTLVWHSQTPKWVFYSDTVAMTPVSRDTLVARMRDHIRTVMGRYKGRIKGWDVVNEALNEDGTLRDSPWRRIIGDDYIAMAFRFAQETDPAAELYYNDFSLENPEKRDGAVRLVRGLQAAGVKITGIGSQEHLKMDWPSVGLVDSMLTAFSALGVRIHLTEVDIDVLPRVTRAQGAEVSDRFELRPEQNPYTAGLPDSVQQALAARYGEIFSVYLKHRDAIDRVTFWGVRDGDSWLNRWPVRGRTSYPLLFDRAGNPKPAFYSVVAARRQMATPAVTP